MEQAMNGRHDKPNSTIGWIVAGAALGLAAAALLAHRKTQKALWDTDSVLNACDRAAEKLEEVLRNEAPARQAS